MEERIYVGLGANLGDCGAALLQALHSLAALPQTQLLAVSSLYSSAPVGASGPDYLNAVAAVQTQREPMDFLHALQQLELAAGRERPYRNAPRTLDLDILLWGQRQLGTAALTVPHPRMYERAFVLRPLAELDATLVQPQQLQHVAQQRISVFQGPCWAALAVKKG